LLHDGSDSGIAEILLAWISFSYARLVWHGKSIESKAVFVDSTIRIRSFPLVAKAGNTVLSPASFYKPDYGIPAPAFLIFANYCFSAGGNFI
jgi:hypothetical protein